MGEGEEVTLLRVGVMYVNVRIVFQLGLAALPLRLAVCDLVLPPTLANR
jgi:hypothetical protein